MFQEIELFGSNIEKVGIFSQKKAFLLISYISRYGTLHFSARPQKLKKSTPRKISYTLGNENPEKFLIFFSKESCSYVSGSNFQSSKKGKTHS